ncbi:hypothetical protein ZHAS_00020259 [Anopheles sinensis]|uniref:Uncharacterized protein n=1 Tax=Anopheles sinensis TaxID=74873 RepID=A0A084WPC8_ANOSI|nr:hypothetical protein ZHAS_00020259 [Anopheles sinensis]
MHPERLLQSIECTWFVGCCERSRSGATHSQRYGRKKNGERCAGTSHMGHIRISEQDVVATLRVENLIDGESTDIKE